MLIDPVMAAGGSKAPIGAIVFWSMALIVLIVVAWMIMMAVRNRTLGDPTYGGGTGLTLSEIRAMRANGEIDEAEFESLRKIALKEAGVDVDGGESPGRSASPEESEKTHDEAASRPGDETDQKTGPDID